MGMSSRASGLYSTAMGVDTIANGQSSTAMGNATKAYGSYSTAMGEMTTAFGDHSTAMGYATTASGDSSIAIGNSITAGPGNYSIAMGYTNTASGILSVAIGEYVTASAICATAFGKGVDDANPLVNNIENAFMVGFARIVPTFTVFKDSVTINGSGGATTDILVLSTGTVSVEGANIKLFRFQTDGHAKSKVSFDAGGADYAEWFKKEENINTGDIVGLNLKTKKVRKYISGDALIGICSSKPGFVGNNPIDKSDEELKKEFALVGLVGQLDFNKEQVNIINSKVETKDGKQIGYLLDDNKVFLKIKD
jgi:hypothetical protein